MVREILSCADAVIGSLTKDFCVNKGGIVATNDAALFSRLQELVQEEGAGIDLIDRKLIALSLQNRKHIEARCCGGWRACARIWRALHEHGVPVVQPAGGHCVLIDVRQIAGIQRLQRAGRLVPGVAVPEHRDPRRRAQRGDAEAHAHQRSGPPGHPGRAEAASEIDERRSSGS